MDIAAVEALAAGVAFGLSLIVAVGPQNVFVLRQGLRREHVGAVVAVCTVSDVALIAAGTAGAGTVLAGRARLVDAVTVLGAAFLIWYAVAALRRALRGGSTVDPSAVDAPSTLRVAVSACLAFTWLNPGVYLDTVVVLGPVSHAHGRAAWWFAAGAMAASAGWFGGLGFGSRAATALFTRPAAWRALDAGVAAVLVLTAARLLAGLG